MFIFEQEVFRATPSLRSTSRSNEVAAIKQYFKSGYTIEVTLDSFRTHHDIQISMHALKMHLKQFGQHRWQNYSSLPEITQNKFLMKDKHCVCLFKTHFN